jgi:proton-translocating NAD(P)+ transhydrogenase subunit alpha
MVPSVCEKLIKLGAEVCMQSGAGESAGLPDSSFRQVTFMAEPQRLVSQADVVLSVQAPAVAVAERMKAGAILLSFIYEYREPELVRLLTERKVTCFAMERVPRVSRAQAMDALSSQASLAGYCGALLGATHLARVMPRMSTAAGLLRPAQVLVIGLGVAGLQAVATAQRLGAAVEGYDVRPETKEQASSLGARFVDTGVDARGEGGYARELTSEERERVASVLTRHIQQADIVITTAAVPGRVAPKLISKAQVEGMRLGAVIVDLAADGGGNCEYTKPGETVSVGPATIVAPMSVPSLVAAHASELYAKNVFNLLELVIRGGEINPDWQDEILAGAALIRGAAIMAEQTKIAEHA